MKLLDFKKQDKKDVSYLKTSQSKLDTILIKHDNEKILGELQSLKEFLSFLAEKNQKLVLALEERIQLIVKNLDMLLDGKIKIEKMISSIETISNNQKSIEKNVMIKLEELSTQINDLEEKVIRGPMMAAYIGKSKHGLSLPALEEAKNWNGNNLGSGLPTLLDFRGVNDY